MSRSHRFTLEDVSKLPAAIQAQVAEQLYGKAPVDPFVAAGEKAHKLQLETVDKVLLSGLPPPTESSLQIALIEWWHFYAPTVGLDERLLLGLPLQGKRTVYNAVQMKREGQRRGTPDLFLALRRGDRCGLWIEMKTPSKKSVLRADQKEMLKLLSSDYATVVCRSVKEAQAVILAYLSLKA